MEKIFGITYTTGDNNELKSAVYFRRKDLAIKTAKDLLNKYMYIKSYEIKEYTLYD